MLLVLQQRCNAAPGGAAEGVARGGSRQREREAEVHDRAVAVWVCSTEHWFEERRQVKSKGNRKKSMRLPSGHIVGRRGVVTTKHARQAGSWQTSRRRKRGITGQGATQSDSPFSTAWKTQNHTSSVQLWETKRTRRVNSGQKENSSRFLDRNTAMMDREVGKKDEMAGWRAGPGRY